MGFPRRNLVMWMFAALLILAAGMFPLQAVIGQGASETAWKASFLAVVFAVTALTVKFTRGLHWQALTLVSLMGVALWAYHFPKIGVDFMPPLDEGTMMDMPVTAPRVSLTQVADDLKARDALLRGFPEVASVIGKAGRASTPTDPAPWTWSKPSSTFGRGNCGPSAFSPSRMPNGRRGPCCRPWRPAATSARRSTPTTATAWSTTPPRKPWRLRRGDARVGPVALQ